MRIAVLPGDGIGPEIVAQVVKVLEALNLNMQLGTIKVVVVFALLFWVF